ncbi:MAG: hypothetical protein MUD16_04500 [Desulfobacterales bacterium]|jgi:hypothetical protein|nr:hypothetical protein [Desulfobacterales bacterium]
MTQVEPLKKVTVDIRTRPDPQAGAAAPVAFEVAFVCGIGRTGITPFESLLAGRRVGDAIDLRVSAPEAARFFEHLAPLLRAAFAGRDTVELAVRITRITPAEGREVVRAMAEVASSSEGGCDCGCGCG